MLMRVHEILLSGERNGQKTRALMVRIKYYHEIEVPLALEFFPEKTWSLNKQNHS